MKRISCVLLSMLFVLTMCVPVFADDETTNVWDSERWSGTGNQTQVEYQSVSTFSVIIPKTVVLPGSITNGKHTTGYNVTVKGDIGSDSQICVRPDSTFALRQTGRNPVTATVTQDAQIFRLADTVSIDNNSHIYNVPYNILSSDTGCVISGTIAADALHAGTWHGTYNYSISLDQILNTFSLDIIDRGRPSDPPEDDCPLITKVRSYKPDGTYLEKVLDELEVTENFDDPYIHKEIIIDGLPYYPGCKVVLYHDSSLRWDFTGFYENYMGGGINECCSFIVPDDATGSACLMIVDGTNVDLGSSCPYGTNSWIEGVTNLKVGI